MRAKASRLAALLLDSRRYQNDVSERLAQQVLHALYELLRGLQAANDATRGQLLQDVVQRDPNEVYRSLLTVLLRLVFLLYAEERGMLPQGDAFLKHYSLSGLHERLTEDAALHPDTMEQRYGAWAQLLVLFRLVYDGADSGDLALPARHGELFDPDRYPFLEGRTSETAHARSSVPLVPDGTVQRALESLLVLDGERLSYRALDVEQIGSVYETMMGFRIETTTGRSVAVRAQARHGAPTVIDLDALLEVIPGSRAKWVADNTGRKLTARVQTDLKIAKSVTDLHAALQPVTDHRATPDLAPPETLVLQPSDERRRSGSHYTPRELTEPIVRTTLEPILQRLAGNDPRGPTPEQILELKVCDPAMGSGAFLVEACRQLGDALVAAWRNHDATVDLPKDEDEVIYARRLIAQRCLYGVDRNPVAVDLAKVSLWLITLAKEHPLTFLDHALRHGDSLVGLSKRQLQAFHWDDTASNLAGLEVDKSLHAYATLRELIREPDETVSDADLRALWDDANNELKRARLYGDLAVAAFFEADSARAREAKRAAYAEDVISERVKQHAVRLAAWRHEEERPLVPFHWEIEFPEVFEDEGPGFDCLLGNPPYMGGKVLPGALGPRYSQYLKAVTSSSKGSADLAAYFVRRAFDLIRLHGTIGFVTTTSLSETSTRVVGLDPIVNTGLGEVYARTTRLKWPGAASVHVSCIWLTRLQISSPPAVGRRAEGRQAQGIRGQFDASAAKRLAPEVRFSAGTVLYGESFVIPDERLGALVRENPGLQTYLRVYVNGDVLNGPPAGFGRLRVVDFGERDLREISGCDALLPRLISAVASERSRQTRQIHESRNWLHWDKRTAFWREARKASHVLVCATPSRHLSFRRLRSDNFYMHSIVVFAESSSAFFSILQSSVHLSWAWANGSTLGSALRYGTSTVFRTFPLPRGWRENHQLIALGTSYHDLRESLLGSLEVGTTELYNRFHDPNERSEGIALLRRLHVQVDRAVLDAYGWNDIPVNSDFRLDNEVDAEDDVNKKKPYRYRWPDDVQDEVLARLLELNAERAAEEAATAAPGKKTAEAREANPQGGLF
jgi:hypothetical protein